MKIAIVGGQERPSFDDEWSLAVHFLNELQGTGHKVLTFTGDEGIARVLSGNARGLSVSLEKYQPKKKATQIGVWFLEQEWLVTEADAYIFIIGPGIDLRTEALFSSVCQANWHFHPNQKPCAVLTYDKSNFLLFSIARMSLRGVVWLTDTYDEDTHIGGKLEIIHPDWLGFFVGPYATKSVIKFINNYFIKGSSGQKTTEAG